MVGTAVKQPMKRLAGNETDSLERGVVMSRIGIYNLEPKYRNLALDKIRCFYRKRGDEVKDCSPLEANAFDVVYASSIFRWTSKGYVNQNMIIGGTGFNLETQLPPEIEAVNPHLNYGFTTRGCIRHCPFCVVPQKEGSIRIVGDLYDLWDGKTSQITLYDNNILALPEHFTLICEQAKKERVELDFNQGLDYRLLTPEIVDILKSIKHHEYRLAFDEPAYIDGVEKAIRLLQSKGINRCLWYVLVGFDTTFQQDLDRLYFLKKHNQNAFVQRYRGDKKLGHEYITLARWANQHNIFQGMTYQQFLETK